MSLSRIYADRESSSECVATSERLVSGRVGRHERRGEDAAFSTRSWPHSRSGAHIWPDFTFEVPEILDPSGTLDKPVGNVLCSRPIVGSESQCIGGNASIVLALRAVDLLEMLVLDVLLSTADTPPLRRYPSLVVAAPAAFADRAHPTFELLEPLEQALVHVQAEIVLLLHLRDSFCAPTVLLGELPDRFPSSETVTGNVCSTSRAR